MNDHVTSITPRQSEPQGVATASPDVSAKKQDEKIWNNGKAVIKLSKPIMVHGEKGPVRAHELVLSEPNFGTQRRLGSPQRQIGFVPKKGEAERVEILTDYEVLAQYLEEITPASIDMGLLDELSMADVRKCEQAIMALFQDVAGN